MTTRPWIFLPLTAALFVGVACQSGHTQPSGSPQVVTVPLDGGTGGEAMHPASGDSTPEMQTPPVSAPSRMSYNSCNVEGPYIALTFDDGPHGTLTPKLLDLLKERGVKATFFVIGQCVQANPDVVKRAAEEGHEIANHTWDHKSLTKLSAAGVAAEMDKTTAIIEAVTGKKPAVMRPPYGATNASITRRMNEEFGLKVIIWDVDPLDWKVRNAGHVQSAILKGTKAGSIVLSHDIHPTTIAAMPATIDALLAKGFKFVTVSELLTMDRPVAATPKPAPEAAAN